MIQWNALKVSKKDEVDNIYLIFTDKARHPWAVKCKKHIPEHT